MARIKAFENSNGLEIILNLDAISYCYWEKYDGDTEYLIVNMMCKTSLQFEREEGDRILAEANRG